MKVPESIEDTLEDVQSGFKSFAEVSDAVTRSGIGPSIGFECDYAATVPPPFQSDQLLAIARCREICLDCDCKCIHHGFAPSAALDDVGRSPALVRPGQCSAHTVDCQRFSA